MDGFWKCSLVSKNRIIFEKNLKNVVRTGSEKKERVGKKAEKKIVKL